MRTLMTLALSLGLACGAFAKPADAARVDAYLDSLRGDLSSVRTLSARFTQSRRLAVFADTLESSGWLAFEAPDRLRWEVQKPYASALILSGGKVAKWDMDPGAPRRARLGSQDALQAALRQIVAMLKGDFGALRASFDITLKPGQGANRLVLAPKSAALAKYIKSMDFTVDERRRRVTRLLLKEPGGDSTEIRFMAERENQALPKGTFDVDSPAPAPKAD